MDGAIDTEEDEREDGQQSYVRVCVCVCACVKERASVEPEQSLREIKSIETKREARATYVSPRRLLAELPCELCLRAPEKLLYIVLDIGNVANFDDGDVWRRHGRGSLGRSTARSKARG